ncbi:MAG: hypothetical protein NTY53_21825 [Kiritimatiellaeota bacterium]|nr:hypothetical protein [Kiritimatiellota bacterium]
MNRNKNGYPLLGLLVLACLGGLTGCTSARVHTTLAISGEAVPQSNGAVYRIAVVEFLTPTNVTGASDCDFGEFKMKESDLRDKLSATALASYPKVFATNAAALPLEVRITRSAHTGDAGADACLSCVTLTIVPLRSSDKTSYTVQTKLQGEQKILSLVEFDREDLSWMSCLPTGWIPVPGGKGTRVTGMESGAKLTQDLMLKACVEAIAMALRRSSSVRP